MNISRLNQSEFVRAYNILCAEIPRENAREASYPTFCRIPVHSRSLKHSHFEPELFYIISGQGQLTLASECSSVSDGDLIRIPPFVSHELVNSGNEELVFLSIFSEDFAVPHVPDTVIVSAAPPTPNGPLHLGHISGPYLASDIVSRYLQLRGAQVIRHCGTDDHQNYVQEGARCQNVSSDLFRRQMRSRILDGLANFKIAFDEFQEPEQDASYQKGILKFFKRACDAGVIQKKDRDYPFCIDCNQFLCDALIEGSCPNCTSASHGACENCGLVVPPYDLIQASCTRCRVPVSYKPTAIFIFSLKEHLPLVNRDLAKLHLAPKLHRLIQRVQQGDASEVALTCPGGPGIAIPDSPATLHVWFEMAAHYEQFALAKAHWVHCFGFDNGFYYLLFIPTLLRALNPQAKLPETVISNEFLSLDGAKFSTSRKHAIWADEFEGNIDHLRFYLALHRPAFKDVDFSLQKFTEFSKELTADFAQLHLLASHTEVSLDCDCMSEAIVRCNRTTRELESALALNPFDLRRACRLILEFMDHILQSSVGGPSEKLRLRTFASILAPFMPCESDKLLLALGREKVDCLKDWAGVL